MIKDNTHQRYYEIILSTSSSLKEKEGSIMSLLKLSFRDQSHFNFLLNQINWFEVDNLPLINLLPKVIRLYRGTSKSAGKVIYNLLADGMLMTEAHSVIVETIIDTLENSKDYFTLIKCLRQNYPHKVCPTEEHQSYLQNLLKLCERIPQQRGNILSIIIENLSLFDTEIMLGEEFINQVFPQDDKIIALKGSCSELQIKYDKLLSRLIEFFNSFSIQKKEILLKEVFTIFENLIINVDGTKTIQYILYYLGQSSLKLSEILLQLWLENIFYSEDKRKFVESNHYFSSYLARSKTLMRKKIKKTTLVLMNHIQERLKKLPSQNINSVVLHNFGEKNNKSLHIFQTILRIFLYHPSIKESFQAQINELITISHKKLLFEYFIDYQLLQSLRLSKIKKCQQIIEFKNKFLPCYLPETSKFINEENFKINSSGKRIRQPEAEVKNKTSRKKKYKECLKSTPITNNGAQCGYSQQSFQC